MNAKAFYTYLLLVVASCLVLVGVSIQILNKQTFNASGEQIGLYLDPSVQKVGTNFATTLKLHTFKDVNIGAVQAKIKFDNNLLQYVDSQSLQGWKVLASDQKTGTLELILGGETGVISRVSTGDVALIELNFQAKSSNISTQIEIDQQGSSVGEITDVVTNTLGYVQSSQVSVGETNLGSTAKVNVASSGNTTFQTEKMFGSFDQAIFAYQLETPAKVKVSFGETEDLPLNVSSSVLTKDGYLVLSALTAETKYFYRVSAVGENDEDLGASRLKSFTTAKKTTTTEPDKDNSVIEKIGSADGYQVLTIIRDTNGAVVDGNYELMINGQFVRTVSSVAVSTIGKQDVDKDGMFGVAIRQNSSDVVAKSFSQADTTQSAQSSTITDLKSISYTYYIWLAVLLFVGVGAVAYFTLFRIK